MPARPPSLPLDVSVQQGTFAPSSIHSSITTPLSFLLVSQNIGSIDCTGVKGELPQELQTMTHRFLQSLGQFLKSATTAKYEDDRQNVAARRSDSSEEECGSPMYRSRCAHMHQYEAAEPNTTATSSSNATENKAEVEAVDKDEQIDVIVWHLQEIGGKKYNDTFNQFLGSQVATVLPNAAWCSGLLMQAQNCDSSFTAMGVVIFLSKRVAPLASILSVRHRTYVAVLDDPTTYTGNSGCLFLNGKFSNAEKSRKGYLLTSLRIANTCMNFVNLHLYHDADNSTAAQSSPSKYTPRRVEAFLEAMSEVVPVINIHDPLFIFGDLNTRLDGKQVVDHLREFLSVNGTPASIEMGKKEIRAPESFWDFFMTRGNHKALQQFDREPQMLLDQLAAVEQGLELCELPVYFPPTYMLDDATHADGSFQDGQHLPTEIAVAAGENSYKLGRKKLRQYKRERLPAWCDRILMNAGGLELITGTSSAIAQSTWRTQNRVSGSSEKPTAPNNARCVYDSVSLEAMDHEAVFLLF